MSEIPDSKPVHACGNPECICPMGSDCTNCKDCKMCQGCEPKGPASVPGDVEVKIGGAILDSLIDFIASKHVYKEVMGLINAVVEDVKKRNSKG